MDENDQNGRVVGREYGVAGPVQLAEKKAERAVTVATLLLAGYYFPAGATEPVPIEE